MIDQSTLDHLDTCLGETAAALMKSFLRAARLRADADIVNLVDSLTSCRLIITGVGAQLQVELLGDVSGETVRFFGATFVESSSVLQ